MSVKRKKPSTYLDVLLDEYDQQNANLSGGPRPKRSKVREVVLPVEILRRICSYLTDSRDLAAFTAVNHACLTAALLEKQKTLLPDGVLDIKRTFFNNPFNPVAVKQILHCRHNNLYVGYALMRQRMEYLCKALESHLESTEFTDGIKSLRNFDLRSLQLFSNFCACSQSTVVPTDLQKRLKKIIKSLSSLECVGLPTALLKPKRFFQAIEKKFDSLVSLDLQHVAQTESINLYDAFGAAHNLKELTWYCAEMEVLKQLPAPHALTRLRIKILSSEVMELGVGCASALALFQGLKELFVGIYVTEDNEEDLSDLKEFFCCWWANSSIYDLCELEEKEGFEPVQPHREKTDYLIQAFPKLTSLGLQWVPNKFLFILQKREQICHQLEELSFGCADDICAAAYDAAEVAKLDSIFSMAVRKAQERVMPVFNLKRLNLCIRFDNTNVVSTHLHKIFDGIAILFPNLQELGLVCRIPPRIGSTFVQKWFSFKPEEFQKPGVLENFRKMKIHLRCGDCHLTGLHDYVPNNIEDLAISIDYVHDGNPPDNRDIVFFLDRISDAERFENLQKLHVQVTGVQCFEQLVHVIPKIHGSLQEMSILSPAVTLKSDKLLEKIKSCIDGMQYLNCLRLSRSFLEQLLLNHSKYKDTVKQNWRQALVDLADDLEVKRVEIGDLPENLFGINVDHFSGCGQRAEWLFPCSVGSAEAIVDEKAFKDMLCHYEYRNIDHFLQKFNAFRNGQSRREEYDQSVQNLVDASNARLFEESLHEYKDLVNSDDSENSFVVSDEEEVEKESEDELEKFERKLEKKQRRRERRRAKKGLPKRRISTSSEEEIEDRDDDLVVNELHANPEIDDESEVSGNEMIDDEAEEGDPGTSEGEQESEVYITDSEEEDDNVIVVKPKMKRRVIIESDEGRNKVIQDLRMDSQDFVIPDDERRIFASSSGFDGGLPISPDMKFARSRLVNLLDGIRESDVRRPNADSQSQQFEESEVRRGPGRPRKSKRERRVVFELRGKPFALRDTSRNEAIYSLCRTWMRGKDEDDLLDDSEMPAPPPPATEDCLDLLATKDIVALPRPRTDIPEITPIPSVLHKKESLEPVDVLSRETLLNDYLPHWRAVKKHWCDHSKLRERRHNKSIQLLETVYGIAQQNAM